MSRARGCACRVVDVDLIANVEQHEVAWDEVPHGKTGNPLPVPQHGGVVGLDLAQHLLDGGLLRHAGVMRRLVSWVFFFSSLGACVDGLYRTVRYNHALSCFVC
jgi:hypothetical protein